MEKIYSRPKSIKSNVSGFCPGCMHGTITKIIAQVIDELNQKENTVLILPIGCGTLGFMYWDIDNVVAAHGRAPAVATGYKRTNKDKLVFTYQGDGDLASIGLSEILCAGNRGENFTVIFVNNSIYGMTGGQMAPTTLVGQKSTTTPLGRNPQTEGYPMKMAELISSFKSVKFSGRFAVDTPANVIKTRKAIKKAFEMQLKGEGFSFIEILSNCPTNLGCSPLDSMKFIQEQTMKEFPLGIFKEPEEDK